MSILSYPVGKDLAGHLLEKPKPISLCVPSCACHINTRSLFQSIAWRVEAGAGPPGIPYSTPCLGQHAHPQQFLCPPAQGSDVLLPRGEVSSSIGTGRDSYPGVWNRGVTLELTVTWKDLSDEHMSEY